MWTCKADRLDVRQPSLASIITDPALVKPMFRVLSALQLLQKDFQISRCDNGLFDVMVNWIICFSDILRNSQFSGAVVVGKALRNQDRPMGKILVEVRADIENQILRRAAAAALPDFIQNIRLDHFQSLCHVEGGKVRLFQLYVHDSPQQV